MHTHISCSLDLLQKHKRAVNDVAGGSSNYMTTFFDETCYRLSDRIRGARHDHSTKRTTHTTILLGLDL